MRHTRVWLCGIAALAVAACMGQAVAGSVPTPSPSTGADVFPFAGETPEARRVGRAVAFILDHALGNSPMLPARQFWNGDLYEIRQCLGQMPADPVPPAQAADIARRAAETAAICGTVSAQAAGWRVTARAYDLQGKPLGDAVTLAGDVVQIEGQLPQAARALAFGLSLPAGEADRVAKWAAVPGGGLAELVQALAADPGLPRFEALVKLTVKLPDFAAAYTLALETLLEEAGDAPIAAQTELRNQAAARFSDQIDVLLAVGRHDVAWNHPEFRDQTVAKLKALAPEALQTRILDIKMRQGHGDHDGAVAVARDMVVAQPDSATAHNWLAKALAARGRAARAGNYFAQMTEENQEVFGRDLAESLQSAQRAADLDPGRADIWQSVLKGAMETSEDELVQSAFEHCFALMPYRRSLWESMRYYYSPGYSDDPKGWLAIQRRLLTAPEGTAADMQRIADFLDWCRWWWDSADMAVELRLYEKALALSPGDLGLRAKYVYALLAAERVADAEQQFGRLMKPGTGLSEQSYRQLEGNLLRAKGDLAGARAAFEQAGQPRSTNIRTNSYNDMLIAETYVREGNLEAAQELLEGDYLGWRHFWYVNYLLGYVYHQQGNDADARGLAVQVALDREAQSWLTPVVRASVYPLDMEPVASPPAPPSAAVPAGWKLILQDDFAGSELGPGLKAKRGTWRVESGTLVPEHSTELRLLDVVGDYRDVQIEFQVRRTVRAAWPGVFLRVPGGETIDYKTYVRFLLIGSGEFLNIHPAHWIDRSELPTISPGDWWWVRVRVQGREVAAWISPDRKAWTCVDWGTMREAVPEQGQVLLSLNEWQDASYRHVSVYAPEAP